MGTGVQMFSSFGGGSDFVFNGTEKVFCSLCCRGSNPGPRLCKACAGRKGFLKIAVKHKSKKTLTK